MKNQTTPAPDAERPWMATFIPLPKDPAKLTIEDVKAAFVGDWNALKEVKQIAQKTRCK